MKTDQQLQQDVLAELNWDPAVQANAIGVLAKNGIVTIAGHVASFSQKLAAEKAAQRVSGVKGVVMEVDVFLPGSARREDADLARAAAQALDWNAAVPRDAVQIIVHDGWITISGEMEWAYQRAAAVGAIRYLVGLKGIHDEITLRTRQRTPDARQMKKRMLAALHRQAQLDADAITIDVDGSCVTLRGVVDSWSERMAARNAAWSAPGVENVIDKISVAADDLAHV